MIFSETPIKIIIKENKIDNRVLAKHLGVSYSTVMHKLKTNSFTYPELVKLGKMIGAELKYTDIKTGEVSFVLKSGHFSNEDIEKKHKLSVDRMALALKKNKMSAGELARRSGYSRQGISKYLNGKRQPKEETLRALAKALEVSPEWLAGEE